MKCRPVSTVVSVALLLLFTQGCTRMGRYNVAIESTSATDSIQVDLVGVNDAEYDLWANYPMDEYWAPGNSFRKNAKDKVVLRFGMGRPQTQVVGRDAEAWDACQVRKCRYLFVLTNAGRFGAQTGSGDPRRLILPLETSRWDGKTIEIEVRPGGLVSVNGPLPE